MAYTAHKDEESIKEHYDSAEVLAEKVRPAPHPNILSSRLLTNTMFIVQVDKLVVLIRKSKHFVVFTGAGISTSAGFELPPESALNLTYFVY